MNRSKIEQARGMLSVAIDLAGMLPATITPTELDVTMEHVLNKIKNKLSHAGLEWEQISPICDALDDGRLGDAALRLATLCDDSSRSPRLIEE